jgi:hypothetical protein
MLQSPADWLTTALHPLVTLVSTIIITIATVFVAGYAYVTIQEGKKNRRKDTIERMLENLYSRLYEILRRARYETSDFKTMVIAECNNVKGRVGPRDCVLSEEQLARVRDIVERYAHYVDSDEQARLTEALSEHVAIGAIQQTRLTQPQYLFLNSQIDPRLDYIKQRRDELRKELDDLIDL